MANEMTVAASKFKNVDNLAAIWFVYPPEALKVAQNFGAAAGFEKSSTPAVYGIGKDGYDQKTPIWSFFIHEMLHQQGLQGHSPKAPWTLGVLLNGGLSHAMNSWDQLANDWASNRTHYCLKRENLTTFTLNLAPIERKQEGTLSIMIKLDDHRALVIESHRRGEFSPGMPNAVYGLTLQLVDTTKDTTWDSDLATSVYLRPSFAHFSYPPYGTQLESGPYRDSSIGMFNGLGIIGARNGVDMNWMMLEGDLYQFEGITIYFQKSGAVDTVCISRV